MTMQSVHVSNARPGYQVGAKSPSRTARLKRKFIERYPECGTVLATAKAIGLKSRRTVYDWLESDPKFKSIYEDVLLPNRREALASLIYQAALGEKKLNKSQLAAAVSFLKATEVKMTKSEYRDDLVFSEHNQSAMDLNCVGKPIESIRRVVDLFPSE